MDEFDIVKQNLDYILEKGDLYDMIAKKEKVYPMSNAFLKLNIFLLSRMLYVGVYIYSSIKARHAPVEKVYNAQEQIRKILGVNIDIIRSKKTKKLHRSLKKEKKTLSILYKTENTNINSYIDHLKKIADFCELYSINEIVLRENDIMALSEDIFICDFGYTTMSDILTGNELLLEVDKLSKEYVRVLTKNELLKLIERMKKQNIKDEFIKEIIDKIKDPLINEACQSFFVDKDLEKLKMMVASRLTLFMNEDNISKDKIEGKVIESITLHDEYIKIVTYNKDNKIVNRKVMYLYEYLEVMSSQELIAQSKQREKNDKMLIAALYLHLYNNDNKSLKQKTNELDISFYDKIYNQYKEKRDKKIKKIEGLYTKKYKIAKNLISLLSALYVTCILFITILCPIFAINFIKKQNSKSEDKNRVNIGIESLVYTYKKSIEIEKEVITKLIGKSINKLVEINNELRALTGDVEDYENKDEILGIVYAGKNNKLPKYYAMDYATSAIYSEGKIEYQMKKDRISFKNIRNLETIFKVKYSISRKELKSAVKNKTINIPYVLYPVGENYVLTGLEIKDLEDISKRILIDFERASRFDNLITEKEQEMILSMKNPTVLFYYGISKEKENSFVENIEKEYSYTSMTKEQIRRQIIKGLGLSQDATTEEIFKEIKNKKYSKTPIKDAGLSRKIEKLNEEEYYETIAALDSLVCNLSTSLAVEIDKELIYVTGFLDDGDAYIKKEEAHAWAMKKDGTIIDVTPTTITSKEEEKNKKNSGITVVYTLMLIVYSISIINYSYGEEIALAIKIKKVKKLLNNPSIDKNYALIKKIQYGGINLPKKSNPSELIEKIDREFASFNKEELKELKRKIQEYRKVNAHVSKDTIEIVKEIPFIQQNKEYIQKTLIKK